MRSFAEKTSVQEKANSHKPKVQLPLLDSGNRDHNFVHQISRNNGNQAVMRLFEANDERLSLNNSKQNLSQDVSLGGGAGLTISDPKDAHEKEADRMADKILSMSSVNENIGAVSPSVIQRKLSSKVEDKPQFDSLQPFQLGSGSPLPKTELKFMESRFGHNFSSVRIHKGNKANEVANSVAARAFTLGNNIVFGKGEGIEDRRLLAHELTHVVQNRGGERQGMITSVKPNRIQRQQRQDTLNREHAQQAIYRFNLTALRFIEAHRRWTSANYIDFLRRTGGNPELSWTVQQVRRVLQSSITSLPSSVIFRESIRNAGTWTAEALGAALGTEFAPGIGTAIGYLIGRVVSTASSAIYEGITGRTSSAEHAHNVRMSLGEQIEAQERLISQSTREAITNHASLISSLQNNLNHAASQQAINAIGSSLNNEISGINIPDVSDRSFFDRLLHDWVLEHAGDEEDANRQTSEVEWEAARTEVFGSGDSLDNHPEIFAYQTRGHFHRVGLNTAEAENLIQNAETLQNASAAMNTYDGHVFHFDRALDSHHFFNFLSFWSVRHNKLLAVNANEYLNRGGANIDVNLDLTTADGACYVNRWEYEVSFPVSVFHPQPSDTTWFASYDNSIEFSESPD